MRGRGQGVFEMVDAIIHLLFIIDKINNFCCCKTQ